jgi:very-short-patch-repair endonuclease
MSCSITAKKLCHNDDCNICFNRSFASNEKSKFLDDKTINPKILIKCSNKKYDFKCDKCNHIFDISLNNINNNRWCPFCSNNKLCDKGDCEACFEKSFASHDMAKYWNLEKNNNINPRTIFKNSHKHYYFNCDKCEHIFKQQLDVINKNIKCNYCCNPPKALCEEENCNICFEKSFASSEKSKYWNYEKNNNIKPREVFKSSNKKYWLNCNICEHSFNIQINNITCNNQWCNYCANKNLCNNDNCVICLEKSFASHPKAKFWNIEKNKNIKPRDIFKNNHNMYFFDCEDCKSTFEMRLDNINKNCQWCPFCKNKTEKIVYEFLLGNNFKFIKEAKYEWSKNEDTNRHLPFDFVIEDYKLIIEIDGNQHFEDIKHFKNNFKENQERDKYKMKVANEKGYSIIRILQEDIYFNKYDWKNKLLKNIKKYEFSRIIYICKNNEYDCYK